MTQLIQAKSSLIWKAHNGPQTLFHINEAYECLFGGSKGPGKTDCILREGLRQIEKPNYRAIIFRRTYPRLGEIIDRSFKYFPSLGAKYSDKDMQLKIPAWTFPSGAKFAFGHCQNEVDKYNYQGKEFHYIGFDQVEEFTESQYLFLIAQNRTSDSTIRCYIRSTANPGGVGHAWVKKRFIESLKAHEVKYFTRKDDEDVEVGRDDKSGISRSFVPASVYDNPSIIQNDPNYIRRLEQLNEVDKQALLFGNWEVFKGQFFKMWRKYLHVQDKPIEVGFRKFLALDYGYQAPSSVGWWQVDYDGNLHCYRELYKEGFTYEELARRVMELTPKEEHLDYCVADPAIWGDKTHHKGMQGESGAETMGLVWKGFCGLIKADNSRITGWGRMRILMTPEKVGERETVKISWSPRCVNSIRTIPTLIHDEVDVEDLNSDGEDHAADQARYAIMSRPTFTEKEKAPITAYSLEWFDEQAALIEEERKKWQNQKVW